MKRGIEFLQLSVRPTNCLRQEKINYIEDLVVLYELDLIRLPNMGIKSVCEIKEKLNEIGLSLGMNAYRDTNNYQSEKTSISTASDLMEYMNLPQYLMDKYEKNYSDNNISFFAIMDLVIETNLSKKELKILKYRKNYWNEAQITLECLGEELGVTRERIRQIEVKADKKLWSIINKLSIYASPVNFKQQYKLYDNFISDISLINKQDKTWFSDNFLYRILIIFLKNEHQLIIKNKNEYKYIVKKSLANVFDFKGFIDQIKDLMQKANTDYKLDFKGVLYAYTKLINSDINMVEIESICEDLLNLEFDIVLDIDNQIPIKGKNKKSISVYVEEVLNKNNQPMHLDEIYNEMQKFDSEFDISKRYIGNIFVGNDVFIFFDRNSTYGLKSWEGGLTQNSHLMNIVRPDKTNNDRSGIKVWSENGRIIVKGGTIINIVIEYLKQFKEPQHIDDIFFEVAKWRDTSKHKLVSNLKVNNRHYFIFEKNGFIGLTNERAN